MIYCTKCGTELNDSSTFCSRCGTAVGSSTAQTRTYITNNKQDNEFFKYPTGIVLRVLCGITGLIMLFVSIRGC